MSFADWTPEELAWFESAVDEVIAERNTMAKHEDVTPDEIAELILGSTPEELARVLSEEVPKWDNGDDFADGTWVDATPEATLANERLYYRSGPDGVRRHLIRCSCNREGCTYARGSSSARVFLAGGPWSTLKDLQKNALCQLVWREETGDFIIVDGATDDVIALHTIHPVTGARW